jgi:hypothetical protein
MPLRNFLRELLLDANPSFPSTEIAIVTDNSRPCISTRRSVHSSTTESDRWKLVMVRIQSDSCLVVPKRACDSPTESQQESTTKKGRGDRWKLMVRQQSDSCLVLPKRACDSPPLGKENLYDHFSSNHPSLASSSSVLGHTQCAKLPCQQNSRASPR